MIDKEFELRAEEFLKARSEEESTLTIVLDEDMQESWYKEMVMKYRDVQGSGIDDFEKMKENYSGLQIGRIEPSEYFLLIRKNEE